MYRWVVLALAHLGASSFVFALLSPPPVLSLIIDDLGISHAQAGLLMSLFALPGIIVSIPAGLMADRYDTKKICLVSFSLVIGGTFLTAMASSFPFLALGRVVSGIGAFTLVITVAQLTAHWFKGKELGLAMGIYNTSMPLGTIIMLSTMGRLGESVGWRVPILLSSVISGIGLLAFLSFFPRAQLPKKQRVVNEQGAAPTFKVGTPIWILGLTWMCYNGAMVTFTTFGVDYFLSRGYTVDYAGFLTSFFMWGSLLLGPGLGLLIDRIGRKELLIGTGGLSLSIILLNIPTAQSWLVPLILVMPLVAVLPPTTIFALAPDILESGNMGLGYGILSGCSNVGILLIPFLTGLARDITGSYETSFVLMSVSAFLSAVSISALRVMSSNRRGLRPSGER